MIPEHLRYVEKRVLVSVGVCWEGEVNYGFRLKASDTEAQRRNKRQRVKMLKQVLVWFFLCLCVVFMCRVYVVLVSLFDDFFFFQFVFFAAIQEKKSGSRGKSQNQ